MLCSRTYSTRTQNCHLSASRAFFFATSSLLFVTIGHSNRTLLNHVGFLYMNAAVKGPAVHYFPTEVYQSHVANLSRCFSQLP